MDAANSVRSEIRANLALAIPITLAQIGTMAMGLVDTAIVGRVSEKVLAGVALGNTLVFAVSTPALGIFLALEPVASQALGAGEVGRARASFRAAVRLSFLLFFPVALLAWASLALLPLLRVEPAIIPDARAYLLARLPATLPFFLFQAAKTYQQAAGRPRYALEAVVVANVVHAAAGWALVFGDAGLAKLGLPRVGLPALGAVGAGLATTFSSFVMAAWVILVRTKTPDGARDSLPNHVRDPGEEAMLARKLIAVGLPIGLQLAAEVGVFSLVGLLMGRIGGRAAAAHQIAIQLASLSFMGALGIAQATSVRVGTAIGERSMPRARRAGRVGIAMGVAIMGASAVAFAAIPRVLARGFTHEAALVDAAASLITIAAFFQLADGAQAVSAGALRGAADTRFPLVANVIVHWLVGLPLGLTLAFQLGLGARGLWYGLTAGLVVIAIVLVGRFVRITRGEVARV
jgi:MATE family multidrug resistance protein